MRQIIYDAENPNMSPFGEMAWDPPPLWLLWLVQPGTHLHGLTFSNMAFEDLAAHRHVVVCGVEEQKERKCVENWITSIALHRDWDFICFFSVGLFAN